MLRNSQYAWGLVSRAFHWTVVALVAIQIPLGFYMVDVYEEYTKTYADDTLVMQTSMGHHTIGFLILTIAIFRLAWRVTNNTPELPETLKTYQRYLARLTHGLFYIVLIIYPLSGWASLSAYEGEFPIFFFGFDAMPRIVPQVMEGEPFDYPFFAGIHRNLWRAGGVLLALHIFGALWHQYVARDGVLQRMLRGR